MELRASRRHDPLYGDVKELNEASIPENGRRPIDELTEGFRGRGSCWPRCPGNRIIVDVEQQEEGVPNRAHREERIAFSRRNGYLDPGIAYRWEGEDYRIMSSGGDVARRDFWLFRDCFWPDRE